MAENKGFENLPKPKPVLMFDAFKKLAAIFSSQRVAALALGCHSQAVHNVCAGKTMSCQGFYFRNYDQAFVIDPADFGNLSMETYDQALGINYRSYPTSNMTRMGMRYKKKKKE